MNVQPAEVESALAPVTKEVVAVLDRGLHDGAVARRGVALQFSDELVEEHKDDSQEGEQP